MTMEEFADYVARKPVMKDLPDVITIAWHYMDVQSVDPSLSEEQACRVLQTLKRCHDATIGINWDVIRITINDMKSRGELK